MERLNYNRFGYTEADLGRLVLADLERQREHITQRIAATEQLLGTHRKTLAKPRNSDQRTNHMSAAGRAAVAAAQKRRWAKVKREKKAAAAKKLVRVKTFAKIKRAKPQEQPKTAA